MSRSIEKMNVFDFYDRAVIRRLARNGRRKKKSNQFFFLVFRGGREGRENQCVRCCYERGLFPSRTYNACNVVYMCVREQGCYYKKAIEILNEGGKPFLLFKACNLVANSMKGCYVMLAKIAKMRSI